MAPVPLPVLNPVPGVPLRVTPTDVAQFVRLEQCERFLRFRLAERAGQDFLHAYGVAPQRISPLLTLSGGSFEEKIERAIRKSYRSVHYAELAGHSHNRPANDGELVREARRLLEREAVVLFQPRLEVAVGGWLIRGDVDLLRLERHADGGLHALIVDLKSTTEVKVEHRLQVGFYHLMLEALFRQHGVGLEQVQTGVLYRPPADATPEVQEELRPHREAARHWFGLGNALLEIIDDPEAYLRSVRDLVTGPDSTARRVASAGFDTLPYCLSYKCDGCLYNEFCLKDSAEREDLSLLPYMTGVEKAALTRAGVTTIEALSRLKDLTPAGELVTAPGREDTVRQLAATWPVGPRLDELTHRAKQFRRSVRKDGTNALGFIPGKGQSTLPASTPTLNPNLIRVYVEAQHDYLNDRLWCLAALVVGSKDGQPDTARRRFVVHTTDGPPAEAKQERDLFVAWTRDLVRAVVEVAAPERVAPVHFVLFDRHEQRLMLEALARNFPPVLQSAPPLYDLLTQLAGFDSPVATFLSEEVREFKNYPMTCQSLQSLATYLRFDWSRPQPFRDLFKARVFDYLGKLDIGGTSEWYTRRSRFGTNLPLEYAYAAWGELPSPKAGQGDEFADFRHVTKDVLRTFQERRLEAIEHVANALTPNRHVEKTAFMLPDLARYEDMAGDLAEALREFVIIERHVALNEWVGTRHAPPERRVLMGETLLVRYVEADQAPEVADRNRENQRRQRKRAEAEAAHRAKFPGTPFRVPRGQGDEFKWSHEGLKVRLQVETAGVDCGLHEALSLTTLREGDRLILHPRWAVDERLPAPERHPYTPTPRQLLYGNRAELVRIVATEKDASGRVLAATVEAELKESFGGDWSRGYVFPSINRPLEDGTLYTLDADPNDWYGYWCSQVVEGLCKGGSNRLYDLLTDPASWGRDTSGLPGQAKFLAGLFAFRAQGLLHDFEKSKRALIGGYGKAPVLVVQGPPGTGKSYSTAFAVFARLQGEVEAGRDFRVFVTCKTHAATDVLLRNVLDVQRKLRELRDGSPGLFEQYIDERLLEVPLYRVAPHDPPPDGVIHLVKDAEKGKGEPKNADVIAGPRWCVVGITPGGVYGLVKGKWSTKDIFGHGVCDLLVLDEASQMNLPEAGMAALPLKDDGQVVVVGDHRQMPPIVRHDWSGECRRTFKQYQVYTSLFDTLRQHNPPMIRFAESFRLHRAMADFLRGEVYRHDGIAYFSRKVDLLPARPVADPLVAAVLTPEYPLVVLVHEEAGSQVRNAYEQALIEPVIRVLASTEGHGLDPEEGLGVVVPHRAQRAALQQSFPQLCVIDATSGLPVRSAIDTVERFQGGERTVVLVSATESDPAYLLSSGEFLLDPRRLTVALSRAKRKMVLVASRSVFSLFSPDEEVFANSQLWKNLLRSCPVKLWEGDRGGRRVAVWGGPQRD
jgi:predicted RecB family nuclease